MDLGALINHDKVIQVISFLASRIQPLYKTKLIKILYLLDENAVRETGSPVTWLKYKVWKMGPVPKWLFEEISNFNGQNLIPAISIQADSLGINIRAAREPEVDLLSDYEIELLDRMISDYKSSSGPEMIEICHGDSSLWKRIVDKNGLLEQWKNPDEPNTSPFTIDFQELISEDPLKLSSYLSAKENLEFALSLQ